MKQLSEIRQEISHLMRRMEDERLEKMGAYRKGLYYTFATLGLGIILTPVICSCFDIFMFVCFLRIS